MRHNMVSERKHFVRHGCDSFGLWDGEREQDFQQSVMENTGFENADKVRVDFP